MKYLYSKDIKNDPKLYTNIEESVSWIIKEPFVYEYLEKNCDKDIKLLDVGCGNGSFLSKMRNLGYKNIQGADLGNYLKDKTIPHSIVDINTEKFGFEDKSFDVITAFQTLEHLENYFLILQEVTRILKNNGLFIFAIPNQFNLFYRFKFFLTGNMTGWNKDNNHLLFLTRDVFKKTYLENFDLVGKYFRKGPVPMLGRLNVIPGVHLPAKTRLLPRREWSSDRVCFVLRKK